MHQIIINSEKVSENEYKLITENNEYYYKYIDTNSDNFLKEEEKWRNHVIEGQQILLDWIQNKEGECPAYICWNYERRAMLHVKLKNMYFSKDYNCFGSEISPYENKDDNNWVVDKKCPIPIKEYKIKI